MFDICTVSSFKPCMSSAGGDAGPVNATGRASWEPKAGAKISFVEE